MKFSYLRQAPLLLVFFLAACEFSLAQDVTPPPNYTPVSLNQPAEEAAEVGLPEQAVDAGVGAAIYRESCAPCHGTSGLGDGPQAAQLPNPVAAIGSAELAQGAEPADWFQMVTEGNLDNFMPPFGGSLTVQQRWDVLAYVYSLSDSLGVLQAGLPADIEILSFEDAQDSGSEAAEAGTVTVTGRVAHGGGGELPEGLRVNLLGFNGFDQVVDETAAINATGNFTFPEIDPAGGEFFIATVEYAGMTYGSEIVALEAGVAELDLPVNVYETTTDASGLVADRLHIFFEFSSPDIVDVVSLYQVSNPGDETVIPEGPGLPVLRYTLPPEASNLVFQEENNSGRFVPLEDGFGDTRAILPGESGYRLIFAFEMPYRRGLEFAQPLNMNAGQVVVFIGNQGAELESNRLAYSGTTDLGDLPYLTYTSQTGFAAGEKIQFELSGRNPAGVSGPFGLDLGLGFFAGLGVLLAAITAVVFWLRGEPVESMEILLDQIIALDERFEAGQLNERTYKKERTKLKGQLKKLLE